jgi:hypothetical protein
MDPAPRARRSGPKSWSQLRRTSLVTAFLSREAALLAAEAAAMTQQLRRTIAEKVRLQSQLRGRPASDGRGRPRKKS